MENDVKSEMQRPEGRLLERAMAGPPKISGRKLAEMATLSEGRVRQIVNGYKTESGMTLPVVAPAETLARLGDALNLTAADFDAVERHDVSEILRGQVTSGITEEGDLWLSDENELRIELLDWLNGGSEEVPPPTGPLMLWSVESLLNAAAKRHRDEVRFVDNLNSILHARLRGGDGDAEESRGSAPTSRDDYELVAHDEDVSIEDEQKGEEYP